MHVHQHGRLVYINDMHLSQSWLVERLTREGRILNL